LNPVCRPQEAIIIEDTCHPHGKRTAKLFVEVAAICKNLQRTRYFANRLSRKRFRRRRVLTLQFGSPSRKAHFLRMSYYQNRGYRVLWRKLTSVCIICRKSVVSLPRSHTGRPINARFDYTVQVKSIDGELFQVTAQIKNY